MTLNGNYQAKTILFGLYQRSIVYPTSLASRVVALDALAIPRQDSC